MNTYYPPVGFHFKVVFNNYPGEFQFQSVSGLNVEMNTEEISEGGENRFKHTLPLRSKYSNLILKRGLLPNSDLIDWCRKAIQEMDIKPTDLLVSLLNEQHEPLMSWNVVHAYPIKWSVAEFNAEENKILIESLELTYNYFNIL